MKIFNASYNEGNFIRKMPVVTTTGTSLLSFLINLSISTSILRHIFSLKCSRVSKSTILTRDSIITTT